MGSEAAQVEKKTIRVIRGAEARAIAKWEAEGWEYAGQDRGAVRTELTFTRPKPKLQRRALAALVGVGVLAASAIAVGVIFEESETPNAPGSASTSDEAEVSVGPGSGAGPEERRTDGSAPQTKAVSASDPSSRHFKFGQTARYDSRSGPGSTPLEITVNGPVKFEPGPDADLYFLEYGHGAPEFGAVNIYFDVSIKNLSSDKAYKADFVASEVYQGDSAERFPHLRDDGIDGTSSSEIAPGGELTFKEGFSVGYVDTIRFEMRIDGLAGTTLSWDHRGPAPSRP
ncbi:hypothetical protein [Dietzia sp. Alg238-R159]|uniref:hypothetical protein n=1 Tax=Dietzia sp. Alg238-R159 TaxID=2305986 RepID=UPI0013D32028|nr:hypothetical protein [Dietzia sp. Alg238-R159]